MAFFRIRGNSVSILHGVRDESRGVRHIKLYTFSGLDALRAALEEEPWRQFQIQMEQSHPGLVIKWKALHEQGMELCSASQRKPNLLESIGATQRAARKLIKSLSVLPESSDIFLKAVGPQLVEVIRMAMNRYNQVGPMKQATLDGLLDGLFPDPERTEYLVERGRQAFQSGQVALAKKRFAEARAYDPFDPDVLNSEAVAWMARGKYGLAEPLLVEARSMAYHQLPHLRKSYSWYQHEVRPYIRATYNLALVRREQERWEEALELCQECLERCPDDGIGARYLLGPFLQSAGHLRLAAEEHRNACGSGLVDTPDSYFDLCNVELQLGHTLPAVEAFCAGVRVNRHVPGMLLKKPVRSALPPYMAADSEECAKNYVEERRSTWTAKSLATVRALWKDPVLCQTIEELVSIDDQLQAERPGERRTKLLDCKYRLQETGLGPAAARALHLRALGPLG